MKSILKKTNLSGYVIMLGWNINPTGAETRIFIANRTTNIIAAEALTPGAPSTNMD